MERHAAGKCLVLPVFIADESGQRVSFDESAYPAAPHALSRVSIRQTLAALFKINGVHITVGSAVDIGRVVARARQLLSSKASQRRLTADDD